MGKWGVVGEGLEEEEEGEEGVGEEAGGCPWK